VEETDIIRQHLNDDVYALSAKDGWYGDSDKKWLLQQIQSRQKAKSKLPSWYGNFDLLFPPPVSVEQASSELTASYKAALVEGGTLVDATGGMGVDSSFFARHFQQVVYLEMQSNLVELARRNFAALELSNVEARLNPDGSIDNLPDGDCVFLDPSRREAGRRVFLIEDCSPDLIDWWPQLTARYATVLVKLSPMYDITSAVRALAGIAEIHVVAVAGEVKELLLLANRETTAPLTVTCADLARDGAVRKATFPYDQRNRSIGCVAEVGRYLYEPAAPLLKAELMNAEAARCGLGKLHPHSHLYTASALVPDFFGRSFEVEAAFGMGKADLKAGLQGLTNADITVRNFPIGEAELRKRLRLGAGGGTTLFATTLGNKHILIRTHKTNPSSLSKTTEK
jgi:hypothetical protein